MKNKENMNKYYKKMALEGIIKSSIFGLIIGAALGFGLAGIFYLVSFDGVLISIIAGFFVFFAASIAALIDSVSFPSSTRR